MLRRPNRTFRFLTGFTLIEMMVAVSLFVVVAMIASGALITAQRISQKARAIKLVMDNLNFALDGMALKMRSGGAYQCLDFRLDGPPSGYPTPDECAEDPGGVGVFFQSGDKNYVYQSDGEQGIEYWESGFDGFIGITRPDLTIDELRFYVFSGSSVWPRVMVTIYGWTKAGGEKTEFGVQTNVTER